MARKPHPSSVLKTLPDSDQEALFEFLKTHTLAEGVQWLVSNNDVRTNDSSLSDWRAWYDMNRTIGRWQVMRQDLQAQLAEMGADPELIPKIGEAVFLGQAAQSGDVKTFATVAAITQRHVELQARQRQHEDQMEIKRAQVGQKDKAIAQKDQEIEMQRRKIAAQEALLEEQRAAAARAKETLEGAAMDEETRARVLAEVDRAMGIKH